jgi:hypothetical protein
MGYRPPGTSGPARVGAFRGTKYFAEPWPRGAGIERGDIADVGLRVAKLLGFRDGSTGRPRVNGHFARLMTPAGARPGSANEVQ